MRSYITFSPSFQQSSLCVPVLSLKDGGFSGNTSLFYNFAEMISEVKKKKNLDIINRVVMLHEANIVNTFNLSLYKLKGCAYQLETLFIYPIKHGVRNLYLEFDFDGEEDFACTLPRLLLTCKTLVDLKLVNCGVIPSSGELFLPSLKKLNLSYVDYEEDESLAHLLSGCPVLEELIIIECIRNGFNIIVSSPTIKSLNVDFSAGSDYFPDKTLIIDVPALIYLKVICYDLECVKSSRKTMTSLIEADIVSDDYHVCDIDCAEHDRSMEFLNCLSHVSHLKSSYLYGDRLHELVRTGSIPQFVNLNKLELDLTVKWHYFVKFLEVADNLEVLIINLFGTHPYKEPKRVPRCMLSRLRTVKMYHFSACQDAFDMVRYILMNAQVLKRMTIFPRYNSSDREKFDALQIIALFERVSKSCQVAFNTNKIARDLINKMKCK